MSVEQQEMLTPEQLDLVTFFSQYYNLTGELLTADKAEEDFNVPKELVSNSLANDLFIKALEERGINFSRFADTWLSKSLTPQQLIVANTLLDLTDQRSNKKKLQDLGVSTATYQTWLKDPVFANYVHTRAEQSLGENKHEVHLALLDKVRSGDIKAISYFNEMTGRFVPQRANAQNFDVQSLIVKIIEIIDMHVTDSNMKLDIANDLKKLIAANNVAAQLVGQEAPVNVGVKEMASLVENEADALELPEVVETNDVREMGL